MLHHWNACRDLLIYILHICRNQREKALNTDPWKYQGALYISEHVNERSVTKLVNRAKLYLIRIHFWKAVISRAVVLLRISKNLGLLGRARGQTNYPALQVASNMWVFTSFLNFFFYSEQHLVTEKHWPHTTSPRSSATYHPITHSVFSDIL